MNFHTRHTKKLLTYGPQFEKNIINPRSNRKFRNQMNVQHFDDITDPNDEKPNDNIAISEDNSNNIFDEVIDETTSINVNTEHTDQSNESISFASTNNYKFIRNMLVLTNKPTLNRILECINSEVRNSYMKEMEISSSRLMKNRQRVEKNRKKQQRKTNNTSKSYQSSFKNHNISHKEYLLINKEIVENNNLDQIENNYSSQLIGETNTD